MKDFSIQHKFIDRARSGRLEYIDDLYEFYYYIVLKHCKKYEGKEKDKAKELAEDILRSSIVDFIKKVIVGTEYNISGFIHNRFKDFDKKVKFEPSLFDLEMLAYQGNEKAIKKLIIRYKYIVDKYITIYYNDMIKLYNEFLIEKSDYRFLDEDYAYPNNLISYEDIEQEFYLKYFTSIKKYYNEKLETSNLSSYLPAILISFSDSLLLKFKKKLLVELKENINLNYNRTFYLYNEKLESNSYLDMIETNLNDSSKKVFRELRKGNSYSDTAKNLSITKQRVGQRMDEIRKIVKIKKYSILD